MGQNDSESLIIFNSKLNSAKKLNFRLFLKVKNFSKPNAREKETTWKHYELPALPFTNDAPFNYSMFHNLRKHTPTACSSSSSCSMIEMRSRIHNSVCSHTIFVDSLYCVFSFRCGSVRRCYRCPPSRRDPFPFTRSLKFISLARVNKRRILLIEVIYFQNFILKLNQKSNGNQSTLSAKKYSSYFWSLMKMCNYIIGIM